jgi:DNA-binding LacI/PurR family transcriptional regulator
MPASLKNLTEKSRQKEEALDRGMLLVDWVENELRDQISRQKEARKVRMPHERVLAKSLDVSLGTVRNAMARLRKDRLIRSVQGKGTFVVSAEKKSKASQVLILAHNLHYLYQNMGGGFLSKALMEKGFTPSLFQAEDPAPFLEHAETIEELAGVITISIPYAEYLQKIVQGINVPVVCVGDVIESVRSAPICDQVTNSNMGSGYAATKQLIHKGHKDIMFIVEGARRSYNEEFLFGAQQALKDNHLPFHEEWCLDLIGISQEFPSANGSYSRPVESIHQQMDRLLGNGGPIIKPTGLVHNAASELQVREVIHEYLHDFIIPENIVAATYAECLPVSYTGTTPAVAICSRLEDIAHRAVELLFRTREKDAPPIREFREELFLYERTNGVWKRKPLMENGDYGNPNSLDV